MSTHSTLRGYIELAKLRLSFLVLVTTAIGFFWAGHPPYDLALFFTTILGTTLSASGANALNQWAERDLDALMRRTQNRPLPTGRLSPAQVLAFGILTTSTGFALLYFAVNLLTAGLAALTVLSYVLLYTPLKRHSYLCTLVGAVPGAIPPVMGATAVSGIVGTEAMILFAILFFWQLPHFYAIAWMYKDDYEAGGYPMLAVGDHDGQRTTSHSVATWALLTLATFIPSLFALAGTFYLVTAVVLNVAFLIMILTFARAKTYAAARRTFLFSVIYLPLLLCALVMDPRVS